MSDKSSIEWTDATWNPVTGCTQVSPGCDHCYAKTFANRLKQWRGLATRYEKRALNYRAMLILASIMLWLDS